jgi:cell division protein FtsI (penicillin-binding protein 3)
MLRLMRMNVTEGTGTRADALGLRVGGKTGTATKLVHGHYVEGKNAANLASFAAIFPTDGPPPSGAPATDQDRYLVLIMLDEPKPVLADSGVTSGGFTAAPAAGRVIDRIAPFLGVRRVILASDLSHKSGPGANGTAGAGADQLGANER